MQGWGTPIKFTYADGEQCMLSPHRCTCAAAGRRCCRSRLHCPPSTHTPFAAPCDTAGFTYDCKTHCTMADRDGVFEHRAPIIYDPKTGGLAGRGRVGWLAGRCAWRAMSLRLCSIACTRLQVWETRCQAGCSAPLPTLLPVSPHNDNTLPSTPPHPPLQAPSASARAWPRRCAPASTTPPPCCCPAARSWCRAAT